MVSQKYNNVFVVVLLALVSCLPALMLAVLLLNCLLYSSWIESCISFAVQI